MRKQEDEISGRCEVCRHERREEIEAGLVQGLPYPVLAREYGVAVWTLGRHKRLHLRAEVQAASAQRGGERRRRLLAVSEEAVEGMRRIWRESWGKDPRLALAAMKGAGRQALWLQGALDPEGDETVEWATHAGWGKLREGLLEVLRPHRKAHEAVVEWLRGWEEEPKKAA